MRTSTIVAFVALGLFLIFGGVASCMWGLPKYRVYSQEMAGRKADAENPQHDPRPLQLSRRPSARPFGE